jgi:hypothetical protein
MGNTLCLQQKMVKIVRTDDGGVLAYKAPIKVHQVLSEFPGHAVSDNLPVLRHLKPETKLVSNQVYHLVPLPLPSPKVGKKKKVRFASPEGEAVEESGVMRIKLVITKKDLQEMLAKGVVSIDDMVADQLQRYHGADDNCKQYWNPGLESIAEVN